MNQYLNSLILNKLGGLWNTLSTKVPEYFHSAFSNLSGPGPSQALASSSAPTTSELPKQTGYTVRGNSLNDKDLNMLGGVLFGEMSNRNSSKQDLESQVITNTALNRMSELAQRGATTTLSNVLSSPKQYQAYNGNEYSRYMNNQLKPTDQQKVDAINRTLSNLKSGNFPDNTGGRVYYQHDNQGRIWVQNGKLFAK